ncbi:MAG: MaoC family dehydratase N-terminal domain-containing protein [Actinomycetota bacterium]|nr:MaoC family dehydratase N-terminal domain-containing protein [Actinomycetota bacterium]
MPSVRDVTVRSDIPSLSRVVTREDVKAYADAGGDHNPLHRDETVARAAGFPGIVAHGMFTMGHLAAFVSRWAGGPERIRRLTAQFRAPVYMGEEIVAAGRVKAVDVERGVALIECWVSVERGGQTESPIKRGEAEVLLDA